MLTLDPSSAICGDPGGSGGIVDDGGSGGAQGSGVLHESSWVPVDALEDVSVGMTRLGISGVIPDTAHCLSLIHI